MVEQIDGSEGLEIGLYGKESHGMGNVPIRANGLPVCPVGIPRPEDWAVIEIESTIRTLGTPAPRTAWAAQALKAVFAERHFVQKKHDARQLERLKRK